jgi:hypothetical protein
MQRAEVITAPTDSEDRAEAFAQRLGLVPARWCSCACNVLGLRCCHDTLGPVSPRLPWRVPVAVARCRALHPGERRRNELHPYILDHRRGFGLAGAARGTPASRAVWLTEPYTNHHGQESASELAAYALTVLTGAERFGLSLAAVLGDWRGPLAIHSPGNCTPLIVANTAAPGAIQVVRRALELDPNAGLITAEPRRRSA